MAEHILQTLSRRYPQLLLPISDETRHSEAYRDAVLCGEELEGTPDFTLSHKDTFEVADTPAGRIEVLSLSERADFEHCFRALAYRCENAEIPPTTGATIISGLINWEKIRRHQEEYLAAGGDDWDGEFRRFTAVRENYRDSIILLSRGYYSALSPADAGYSEKEWRELSYTIRKYHELAHFVSQRLFPENKNALRDEVLADMNGIVAALGHFDAELAGKFLGVIGGSYVPGGRLENYVSAEELPSAVSRAAEMLAILDRDHSAPSKPFEKLLEIEKDRLFL